MIHIPKHINDAAFYRAEKGGSNKGKIVKKNNGPNLTSVRISRWRFDPMRRGPATDKSF